MVATHGTMAEPHIILYSKSSICMANNGKATKHTRKFSRIIFFKEMVKSDFFIGKCGVREVSNWQTLEPRMLGDMN